MSKLHKISMFLLFVISSFGFYPSASFGVFIGPPQPLEGVLEFTGLSDWQELTTVAMKFHGRPLCPN